MNKLLLCAAAIVASSAPAFAADMPARPAPVPVAAPFYDWSGFSDALAIRCRSSRKHIASGERRVRRFSGRLQRSDRVVRAGRRRRLRLHKHQRYQPLPQSLFHLSLQGAGKLPTSRVASVSHGTGCCFTQRAAKPGHSTGMSRSLPPTPSPEPRPAPDGSAAWALNMPMLPAGR